MGVSGCGKSTIGEMLASQLDYTFFDADDFHPDSNKKKMAAGTPLNDDNRKPWLLRLANVLEMNQKCVLACSALKESYRRLMDPNKQYHWVYLKGSQELIFDRMQQRKGHFMKPDMLDSQFATLEEPEDAITVSIELHPQEMIDQILSRLTND